MRSLFGRSANDASANESNLDAAGFPNPPNYRPIASQNVVYHAGSNCPITCIDKSSDGQIAILGGRHILKTVHFDGLHIKEGIDVHSLIKNQSSTKCSSSEQLSIKDVKLAPDHATDPRLFTACASGKIFTYDVSRLGSTSAGLEYIQTREDLRQVNKLDFNPYKATWLLSGGQDGVVRLLDVRAPVPGRYGPTFPTRQAFRTNADGIRDLRWSPKDGFTFACATESGIIMKWDARKYQAPVLKINAHDPQKGASSISWHPDGEHLISGGFDSKCHVWDLSSKAEKRQKPKWTINAPAPVTVVSWRPGLWSATAQGRRAAQVAVSYDNSGNQKYGISSVHIWDLARPTMPYKEIDMFETCPNALLWHDQDLLWTADEDGLFAQCDVAFAPKVIDRQPPSSLDFSARGDVLMFLEERPVPTRPRPHVAHEKLPTSYGSSPSGKMLSISRSDSEEDVLGSFLGPKRRPSKKRLAGSRSSHALSTTPPSGSGTEDHVIPLEQAIKLTGPFKPQQIMAVGRVPAAPKMYIYEYLSSRYLEIIMRELPCSQGSESLSHRVASIMEQYARAAEDVSQFRLAQTWRILSYTTSLLLTRRSQFHLEKRLTRGDNKKSPMTMDHQVAGTTSERRDMSPYLRVTGDETPRKPSSISSAEGLQVSGKSLLTEEIDSESNVPTPLARPIHDSGMHGFFPEHKLLTPVQEIGSFNLSSTIQSDGSSSPRKRLDSTPISIMSRDSQVSSTEGYDFFDVEAVETLPRAIDVPQKKEPLSLDYIGGDKFDQRKSMNRHDSEESFGQMFSLSDGSRQASLLTSSSGGSGHQTFQRSPLSRNNSDIKEEEYESRIRGHQIGASFERARYPQSLKRQESDGLGDDYMTSQATTDTFDIERSQVLHGRSPVRLEVTSPPSPVKVTPMRPTDQQPEEHPSPTITETDYLPWLDDPQYPYPLLSDTNPKRIPPPVDPYGAISKALEYEARHSALNASAIILLLKPLVPDSIIDTHQAVAILRQHHNRLMGLKLFVEAALLRNLCVRGWPDGMDFWGDNYTSVFTPAQERQRVSVALSCARCQKPREVDHAAAARGETPGVWKCENCRVSVAPCAVCGHRDMPSSLLPPAPVPIDEALFANAKANAANNSNGSSRSSDGASDDLILATWWYCPGCSHGGHATCLEGWHAPIVPTTTTAATAATAATALSSASEVKSLRSQHHQDHATHTPATSRPPSPGPVTSEYEDAAFPETYSDGCCPFDGCGHACLPGRWRNESSVARTDDLGRVVRDVQTRGSVPAAAGTAAGKGGSSAATAGERRASSAAAIGTSDSNATAGLLSPFSISGSGSGGGGMMGGGIGGPGVRGDTSDVPLSRAVEHVKDMGLAGMSMLGGTSSSSGGGQPDGLPEREKERKTDRERERNRDRSSSGIFSSLLGTSPGRAAGGGINVVGGSGGSHAADSLGGGAGVGASSGETGRGSGNTSGRGGEDKDRRKSVKFARTESR
ncbi:SEA (Seh1-associated) complex subunit [Diatrype stigma]|uniref:SEA (Seh1-associated) complex subunit n=1 Tax=Diatrype stigma TaxID=117547 RepID=A0AAN9YW87_9PEZI